MDVLDDFARGLKSDIGGFWLPHVGRIRRQLAVCGVTEGDVPSILDLSQECLTAGHPGKAANWLAVASAVDEEKSWNLVRRRGLLRASKNDFSSTDPREVASLFLAHADVLAVEPRIRRYLASIVELLKGGKKVGAVRAWLVRRIRHEPWTLLRGCLQTVDALFMRAAFPDLKFGLQWQQEPWTNEELAEGLSMLWSLAEGHVGLSRWTVGLWDAERIVAGDYLDILKRAALVRAYCEAEIRVDAFDYGCRDVQGAMTLSPPSPQFEKSIRLGFIEQEMLAARRAGEAAGQEALSLRTVATDFLEVMRQTGPVQVVDDLPRRVRFLFPAIPELLKIVRAEGVFQEELSEAEELAESHGVSPKAMKDFVLVDHVTFAHVRQFQRVATIVSVCAATELARWRDDPIRLINSMSSVFRSTELLEEVLGLAVDGDEVQDLRRLFQWPTESGTGVFDIQYRPLLLASGEWHVPMHVASRSNLVRAAMMLTGMRPMHTNQGLLERAIVEALRQRGHAAQECVSVVTQKGRVEIDVVALVDGVLVLLECKASLAPTSMFELRTSHDHCLKAASQLTRARACCEDDHVVAELLLRLGTRAADVREVVTGIVVENRLFVGLEIDGHRVVAHRTLLNVINDGRVKIGPGEVPIRSRPDLAGAITSFLRGEFYECVFSAMVPVTRCRDYDETRLLFDTFALDFRRMATAFGVSIPDEQWEEAAGSRDGGSPLRTGGVSEDAPED